MKSIFRGFLDNLLQGALNPKGNLGDWQHGRALYTNDDFRLAPKHKFLYHVAFTLNADAVKVIPQLKTHELNMLVKSVDLPKYNISTTLKHQYNKKRNLQTRLDYDPINITFHDDNYGVTTAMWEAYYRYYFRDGTYSTIDGAGAPSSDSKGIKGGVGAYERANTYGPPHVNSKRFGMDNDQYQNFFNSIQIFQMSRRRYTSFTLVNPIISSWQHDTMDNSDSGVVSNQMTIQYETVWYARGPVEQGTAPKMFGTPSGHYDTMPSPLTLEGGGIASLFGIGGVASGGLDVLGDITSGKATGSLGGFLGTVLKGANVFKNAKSLSQEGLRQEGFNILKGALGSVNNTAVGGVANTLFPKGSGTGSALSTAVATVSGVATASSFIRNVSTGSAFDTITSLANNPGKLDELAKAGSFLKVHLEQGGSAIADQVSSAYNNLSNAAKDSFRNLELDNAQQTVQNNPNISIGV
tara:strand:+ start:428 stop:1828 length:1401 start_codon:yes stop_codon:yes gene_type:complete